MNRRATFLGVVLALAVVGLWYFLVFSPKGKDLTDARDALDSAKRDNQSLSAQLHQLQELERNRPKTAAQLARLQSAVPKGPNQSDFITSVNNIATDSGISWQSVTMAEPVAAAGAVPPTITVQIKIGGGFHQVLDYLSRLEKLDRLNTVDHVTITEGDGDTAGVKSASAGLTQPDADLSVALTVRIFSQETLDGTGGVPTGSSNPTSTGTSGGATPSGGTTATTAVAS
jgi:Tfp pilus assembly protein PilO